MSIFRNAYTSVVALTHRRPIELGRNSSVGNRELAQNLANLLQSDGGVDGFVINANQATAGACAGATLILASSSGAVGGVINGVTVTDTWAGSDAASAALIAAAINASSNALVQGFVRASNVSSALTLASVAAGDKVSIRVGTSQYDFVAVTGTAANLGEFDRSGTDTQDAAALAAAINAYPILNQTVRAENVAAVCHVYFMDGVSTNRVITASSTVSIGAQPASTARCHVAAIIPGAMGNAITFTASGTNVSVANTNTRLVGGVGGVTGTIKRANVGGAA